MSADLFAEFGTTSSSSQQQTSGDGQTRPQPTPTFSFFDNLTNTAPAPVTQPQPQQPLAGFQSGSYRKKDAPLVDDNDEWGDFEGGQDPFSLAGAPLTQSSQASWQKASIVKAKKSTDPSVLFDAEEDFEDDDDFGDFEGPESSSTALAPPARSSGLVGLLGDMSISQQAPPAASERGGSGTSHKASTLPSEKKSAVGGFGSVTRTKQPTTTASPPPLKQDDEWDTFEDWEASIPAKVPAKAPSKPKETKVTMNTKSASLPLPVLSPTFDDPQPEELPPTNVPPPAVLLSLFPSLFAEAHDKLFKPMTAQTLPMRNKLLAEPGTIAYLQGYLMLASVAAHIVAGRKLRWKRDKHLSQGMSIGPASSRATSGMKLSSVDKSENMKEEREASDVIRAWKDQIGKLRHVVSAANQIKPGTLGAAPDIQETMPVSVLKQSEGGVPAREACMLCGLKRDERVGVVDHRVEDSFGEWWIEQVNMHRACRNFWNEHRDKLRQR
ncbi:hypothetical protein BU26DRAFT_427349 [Trematosphaeria pertusa]|uniref:Serine/threonine-protein kinase ppk6 n=1 Tax=Trematosphaeria pertusa TaxID=390896 RepID=A0A6A6IGT0_9PLEO|nr:uncharacterized protein BU26DRAFT_427349 [Trematosphaeria pertusa]KAF2249092.1 hypothetical protein BU26DRAFT_427349 [Trematosphaeria pertusa]